LRWNANQGPFSRQKAWLARAVAGFLYVKPLQTPQALIYTQGSSNYREDSKKPPMLCVIAAQGDGGFFCATTRAKEINKCV
jgi:hypothetical protein